MQDLSGNTFAQHLTYKLKHCIELQTKMTCQTKTEIKKKYLPSNRSERWMFAKTINERLNYLCTYFICSCQQIVCHFLQVRGLSCIDEAHHFLKNIWVYITDVNAVLQGKTQGFCTAHLYLATEKRP